MHWLYFNKIIINLTYRQQSDSFAKIKCFLNPRIIKLFLYKTMPKYFLKSYVIMAALKFKTFFYESTRSFFPNVI